MGSKSRACPPCGHLDRNHQLTVLSVKNTRGFELQFRVCGVESCREFGAVCHGVNRVVRGWGLYFRYGASSRTLSYLGKWSWLRMAKWLRRKHPTRSWRWVRQRYGGPHWEAEGATFFELGTMRVGRWLYRGTRIPSPWDAEGETMVGKSGTTRNGGEPGAG